MSDVYCPRRASREQDVGQQLHLKRPGARGNAWCKKYQCMSQNCLFSLKESQHRRHTERLSQRMSGIMVIFRHLKRALGMLLSSCKTKYTLDQFCRQLVCRESRQVLVSFASLIAFLQRCFAPHGRRGSQQTQFSPIRPRLVSIISIANWYVLINSALCHCHPE